VKWNLRLVAAQRGIWKATDLQRLLAEHGLVISAGKMSGLWSKTPASLKLEDLDVICEVLGCEVGELLLAETNRVPEQRIPQQQDPGAGPAVEPPQHFAGGRS
jgi:DNA-binding Xre family transcriptional regulator